MTDYDAFLLLSFGGPEGPDDVMPFLENVTRGRGIPPERLLTVAEHYQAFGGKSPINDQCRELLAAVGAEFEAHGKALPLYWGNRNWGPYLVDTLREMRAAGVKRALAFVTSAYGSYSGCRQYQEDVARARAEVGDGAPEVHLLRKFYDHPGFVEANADRIRAACEELPRALADVAEGGARLVFTAHSIPLSMAKTSPYLEQLEETSRLVAEAVGAPAYDLVWQSRSGPPQVPWLEPDVCDHLRTLGGSATRAVVLSPIGFVSDHMEVVYDLDHEARAVADEIGLTMVRAGTAGCHPAYISMIRELVEERTAGAERRGLGRLELAPDLCPADCCPRPERPKRPGRAG